MIDTYVAIDLETTGTNPAEDRIIEVGAPGHVVIVGL